MDERHPLAEQVYELGKWFKNLYPRHKLYIEHPYNIKEKRWEYMFGIETADGRRAAKSLFLKAEDYENPEAIKDIREAFQPRMAKLITEFCK